MHSILQYNCACLCVFIYLNVIINVGHTPNMFNEYICVYMRGIKYM